MAGLPELAHFPDENARAKALAEIGAEAGTFRGLAGGMAVLGGVLIGLLLLFRQVIRPVLTLPPLVEELLQYGAMAGAGILLLRYLHRRGFAGALREKLVQAGVPVCLQCGYSLRGATAAAMRCPECGAELDGRVRAIVQAPVADGQALIEK